MASTHVSRPPEASSKLDRSPQQNTPDAFSRCAPCSFCTSDRNEICSQYEPVLRCRARLEHRDSYDGTAQRDGGTSLDTVHRVDDSSSRRDEINSHSQAPTQTQTYLTRRRAPPDGFASESLEAASSASPNSTQAPLVAIRFSKGPRKLGLHLSPCSIAARNDHLPTSTREGKRPVSLSEGWANHAGHRSRRS